MKDKFEIAGGTVLGREHLRLGKNNQDAFAFKVVDDYAIMAIVCDGCSAGAHTEVGAKLGASIAIESLFSNLAEWGIDGENVYVRFFWDRLKDAFFQECLMPLVPWMGNLNGQSAIISCLP